MGGVNLDTHCLCMVRKIPMHRIHKYLQCQLDSVSCYGARASGGHT